MKTLCILIIWPFSLFAQNDRLNNELDFITPKRAPKEEMPILIEDTLSVGQAAPLRKGQRAPQTQKNPKRQDLNRFKAQDPENGTTFKAPRHRSR